MLHGRHGRPASVRSWHRVYPRPCLRSTRRSTNADGSGPLHLRQPHVGVDRPAVSRRASRDAAWRCPQQPGGRLPSPWLAAVWQHRISDAPEDPAVPRGRNVRVRDGQRRGPQPVARAAGSSRRRGRRLRREASRRATMSRSPADVVRRRLEGAAECGNENQREEADDEHRRRADRENLRRPSVTGIVEEHHRAVTLTGHHHLPGDAVSRRPTPPSATGFRP